jgi:hypothetical protein
MPKRFLEQFLAGGESGVLSKKKRIDIAAFDRLQTEVAVLRDANCALARERDRLCAERDELRSALKILLTPQAEPRGR